MDIVQPFLRSVRDERIASIDCAIARKVKEDASRLLEEEDSEEMASFCSQLTEVLSGFLPSTSKKSSASYIEEKAWSSFLSSRNSSTSDLWKKLYAHVGLPFTSSLLCQRTNRKVFSYLLNTSIGATDPDATENEKDESLSYDEENTLRYAAGFVPFKLMTKFGERMIQRFIDFCSVSTTCGAKLTIRRTTTTRTPPLEIILSAGLSFRTEDDSSEWTTARIGFVWLLKKRLEVFCVLA